MHKKPNNRKTITMKKIMFTLIAVVALAGAVNAVIVPVPTTAVYPPAGLLVATKTIAFGAGTETGTLLSQVYTNGGVLTFVYRLTNTSPVGGEHFTRLSDAGFGAFAPVLSQTPPVGTDVAATNGSISATGTIGFNFSAVDIAPGETSTYLEVSTTAGTFKSQDAGVADGTTFNVSSFAPAGVPDGGSAVALLGIALAGIEGVRRFLGARKA